jgi:hypothetical protein
MTERHTEPEELAESELEAQAASNGDSDDQASVIAALRAQRAEAEVPHELDMEVPGWGGLLVLRLGPIPPAQLNRLVERANNAKSKTAATDASADMLIAACREVWGRKPGRPLVMLTDEDSEPLRLDKRLAEQFQLKDATGETPERARGVVLALYNAVPSPELAVGSSASEYVEWARGANAEIDSELLEG